MNLLLYLSNFMIPFVVFYIVGYGLLRRVDLFDSFVRGVKEGFRVVVGILPTLIGLLMAVGILRASGVLDFIAQCLTPFMKYLHFPSCLVPVVLVEMFSSSAATGLLLDIYKKYGTDSGQGFLASVLMACSETIFYTISVYFMATGEKKHSPVTQTGWLLPGAVLCTLAGVVAGAFLCRNMF